MFILVYLQIKYEWYRIMHDVIKYGDNEIMLDRVGSRNKESPHSCPLPALFNTASTRHK